MKFIIFLLINIQFTSTLYASQINCEKISNQLNKYISNPSISNSKKLLALLPKERTSCIQIGKLDEYELGSQSQLLENFAYKALALFEKQMLRKEKSALSVSLLFSNFVDGHYAEELYSSLGIIITKYPKFYLEVLKENIDAINLPYYHITFLGERFGYDINAECIEIRNRNEALESVHKKELENYKNKALEKTKDFLLKECSETLTKTRSE